MNRTSTPSWLKVMAGAAALSLTLTACGGESNDNEKDGEADAASYTNDVCKGDVTSADTFKVGGILPLTGNLAFLGPPEIAGVGLAVSDINAAGGVGGADACHQIEDSGDSTDLSVSTAAAGEMVSAKPSVVIGAASSSVSLNFVDTLTSNKITQISPANTATDLSGYSDFYFRTAPPDTIQGAALGTLIATDGHKKIAFLVFNDTYGTGLRNFTQKAIEDAGGEVVYGGKGDGDEFPAGQTTFSAEVTAALNTQPDAIVVLAFDETKAIVPELANQGWDMSKTYFTDGNTADYSEVFDEGTLEGAQGTIPGPNPDETFKDDLSGWYKSAEKKDLTDFTYGAESYHAVILAALAATKGGDTSSVTIQKNLAAVSGAVEGSEECSTYEDCVKLLEDGKDINYRGPAGIGPINDKNDPSSAFIGIFQFQKDNTIKWASEVESSS
ncbi:ABC transporter substrate-binding protein [Nocardioides daphniae]|uniref:Amino acid ABC transporter substrate-binding protein n=2 Tax=Nocardioides daphniae TaxID=402297 RepID=A0ABQ1QAD8_9ACTN|nr:ABC transporter substrate-binding protein [Nocardioides daphniae]GGD19079.1 amino acid ABC transporter substrate-binding protein [Nocardioides daphniae]